MGSFGENLRREREMRGVTLEEISAATKISIRFLKSIESEEFSKLPGGIFTRSFIRAYAHYLGLDEEPILAEYQLVRKGEGEADLSRFLPPKHLSPQEHRSHASLAVIVVACGLLAAGYGLWRHSHQSKDTLTPLPKPQTVLVKPGNPSVPGGSSAAPPSAQTPPAGEKPGSAQTANGGAVVPSNPSGAPAATAPSVPPGAAAAPPASTDYGGELVLQIATTERAWLAVDADGKTVMQGIMNPNEVKTFKARDAFDVLTGNAQGVILTLNGQTLKPLGRQGEVKSVHLTSNDLKKQPSP